MLRIDAKSQVDPALSYVEIQEGNIDFGGRLRCVVALFAEDGSELGRKLWQLQGPEFDRWLAKPDGRQATIDAVLKHLGCERRTPAD